MTLQLFGHPFSSYTQKVLIALWADDTPFEYRILEQDHPENFEELKRHWPFGLFPLLLDDGRPFVESTPIIEHLQAEHGGIHRWIPDGDIGRRVRFLDRFFDIYVMGNLQKAVTDAIRPEGQGDAYGVAKARDRLHLAYDWLETNLFFDLVFVFAVTQLSHYLLAHHTFVGVLQTLVMFMAVWWAWMYTAWATNWLDPALAPVRLALIVIMALSMVMSSAIPGAFGPYGLIFALAYVVIQVGRTAYTAWAREGIFHGTSTNMARATLYFDRRKRFNRSIQPPWNDPHSQIAMMTNRPVAAM